MCETREREISRLAAVLETGLGDGGGGDDGRGKATAQNAQNAQQAHEMNRKIIDQLNTQVCMVCVCVV